MALNTVTVEVSYATRPISQEGLSIPVYLIPHNLTANTIDSFVSTASITSAGAAINSPAYMFINNTFTGSFKPEVAKIARLDLDNITITVDTLLAEGDVISVNANVNGVASVVSYTVQAGDTTTDLIATGLTGALDTAFPSANTSNPTFAVVGSVITASPGTISPYKYSFGWNSITGTTPHTTIADTTSESYVTVLTNAIAEDGDFFYLASEAHDDTNVLALAAFAESNDLMYVVSTSDVDSKDSGSTTNLAISLNDFSYKQTSLMWHQTDDQYFPEAGIVGYNAGIRPYTANTLNLATLPGIPVSKSTDLSTQEILTLESRNVNYYSTERNENVLKEGKVSDGNFFDTIRYGMWKKFATRAAVYALLKQQSDRGTALPYSDKGAGLVSARIYNDVINVGINGGAILTGYTQDPNTGSRINLDPIVEVGTRAQQPNVNITNRLWDNVVVETVYAGAIQTVKIKAYVILNRDPQ